VIGSLSSTDVVLTDNLMAEIFEFTREIIGEFATQLVSTEEDKRTGGALAIHDPRRGVHQVRVVGGVSKKDGNRFGGHAANKNYAMRAGGVIISELVADPEADPPVYGGGIQLSNGCFMSFSGFPPPWDQAFSVHVARKFHLIDRARENKIVMLSSDPLQARSYIDMTLNLLPLD
jgi:hypothetical protein